MGPPSSPFCVTQSRPLPSLTWLPPHTRSLCLATHPLSKGGSAETRLTLQHKEEWAALPGRGHGGPQQLIGSRALTSKMNPYLQETELPLHAAHGGQVTDVQGHQCHELRRTAAEITLLLVCPEPGSSLGTGEERGPGLGNPQAPGPAAVSLRSLLPLGAAASCLPGPSVLTAVMRSPCISVSESLTHFLCSLGKGSNNGHHIWRDEVLTGLSEGRSQPPPCDGSSVPAH